MTENLNIWYPDMSGISIKRVKKIALKLTPLYVWHFCTKILSAQGKRTKISTVIFLYLEATVQNAIGQFFFPIQVNFFILKKQKGGWHGKEKKEP